MITMNYFYSDLYINNKRLHLVYLTVMVWIFLLLPKTLCAQFIAQDTTEYRFWYSGFDARSTAMAGANIADPFNLNGLYVNPATLAYSNPVPSLINNSLYNSSRNVLLENVTASLNHSRSHRLAGGVTIQNSVMRRDPVLNPGQLQFSQLDLTLGYGWMISSSLGLGVSLNSMYGKADRSNVWTYNGSLGFLYAPTSLISYGLVYRGTGWNKEWLGSAPVFHMEDGEATTVYSVTAPHRLELGVTLRFPSLVRYPDFVLSFSNEKVFGVDGLIYKGGLEVNMQNFISLRGGYFLSPFAEGSRLGIGLLFDAFNLDYAFAPTSVDLTGKTHQLSISLKI